ncbi:hypothetical protein DZA28_05730 [Pseudomonas alloputida]|jgi:hypothetical protein|uniref:Uncharacterized protein n=3 Tax=Pseudomonas TaxID=286 RepID=I3UYJ9_PSEPU|nr:hypothetical protein YSA_07046 [Pseudomonas putida ND6]ANC84551.1 hypothetical protein KKK_27465 [Pseudomonas putida B6-2]ANI01980.1 hypothetical protein A210_04895 [Pseudomonas putida SJTE-1]ANI36132.1 hypothetical protein AA098_22525 [Pseudomonas sp. JY-Q]AYN09245.1 hypothetical protein CHN49_05130 [Pseudomonas putida]MPT07711.1 hypothetical protein [Pseudomonas sp.]NWL45867.1 hypothetical protein [Pseudomonas hunanensis]POA87090.1 hypothetical protein C1882_08570 [Pseudomonas sp. FW305
MIDTNGAVCSSALDGPGRVVAHQRKSCQFEPVASVLTTPLCTFVRGQVTGAVNHRIMRALYMEVRLWRTGIGLGCTKSLFGAIAWQSALTTQECLV